MKNHTVGIAGLLQLSFSFKTLPPANQQKLSMTINAELRWAKKKALHLKSRDM